VAPVYKLLKAHDLITRLTFVVIMEVNEFKDKTTAPRQLWQADSTYFKVIDWSCFYPSTKVARCRAHSRRPGDSDCCRCKRRDRRTTHHALGASWRTEVLFIFRVEVCSGSYRCCAVRI